MCLRDAIQVNWIELNIIHHVFKSLQEEILTSFPYKSKLVLGAEGDNEQIGVACYNHYSPAVGNLFVSVFSTHNEQGCWLLP